MKEFFAFRWGTRQNSNGYCLLDAAAQRLSYALLTDTAVGNCLTTMVVRDLGPSQAELEWSATFQAAGLLANEAQEMLEGALAANCLALKQFTAGDSPDLLGGPESSTVK